MDSVDELLNNTLAQIAGLEDRCHLDLERMRANHADQLNDRWRQFQDELRALTALKNQLIQAKTDVFSSLVLQVDDVKKV